MYLIWNHISSVAYWSSTEERAWKEILDRIIVDVTIDELKKHGWKCRYIPLTEIE